MVISPELAPDAMSIYKKLWKVINILVIWYGIRIVANTYIVLGMSGPTKLPYTHIDTDHSLVKEDNMANALTLGQKTTENSCLMLQNNGGKLEKMESSILPNYKQLRFLDGRSGIATLLIFGQAIGYVVSIVYRSFRHLPVSPIEVIGCAFSMLVIVHYAVYIVGAICQNPLVVYLNPTQEQEVLHKCDAT
jgi:hypothetical protein